MDGTVSKGAGAAAEVTVSSLLQKMGLNDIVETSLSNLCSQNPGLFDENMFEDLAYDAIDLLHGFEPPALCYPYEEMDSASVVCLMDSADLADDSFLQAIMQTARKTKHSAVQQQKLRLKLINFDGSSDCIEFATEVEYWGLIAAIKKALDHNVGALYQGRCCLVAAGGEAGAAASKRNSAFGSLFTAQRSSEVRCQLQGTKLLFLSDAAEVRLDLQEVKALSLAADFEAVKNLMLVATLQGADDMPNERICCLDSNNNLLVSKGVSSRRGNELVIPISAAELETGRVAGGINKLAIVRAGAGDNAAHTSNLTSKLNPLVSNGSTGVVAEVDIPFDELIGCAVVEMNTTVNASRAPLDVKAEASFVTPQKPLKPAVQRERVVSIDRHITRQITFKLTQQLPAAYRIVIRGAEGLPLENKKAPSTYCTVYLVNEKGDRLTVNTVDARTETAPVNSDPVWNKEFLLRYDGQDVSHRPSTQTVPTDVPTGVMIKVRDAASGFLRHKHIGQVVVPISCFIYHTEATFTLPLDPTYRMNTGAMATLGEVHLLTELVSINPETGAIVRTGSGSPGNPAVAVPSADAATTTTAVITPPKFSKTNSFWRKDEDGPLSPNGKTPGSPRKDAKDYMVPSAAGRFNFCEERGLNICCSIRRVSAWATFWPVRTLSMSSVDARGHLCCFPEALCIRLIAGSAGPVAYCEEAKQKSLPADERVTELLIPWQHVLSVIELSEAVLLLTVVIRSCVSNPSDTAKQQKRYADTEVDLLVAPCPATQMHIVMNHRVAMTTVRPQIASFVKTAKGLGFSLSDRKSALEVPPSSPRSPAAAMPAVVPSSPRPVTRKSSANTSRDASADISFAKLFVTVEDMESLLAAANKLAESLGLYIFDNVGYIQRFRQQQYSLTKNQSSSTAREGPLSVMSVVSSCSSNAANIYSRPTRQLLFDFSKVCISLRAFAYNASLRSVCRDIYVHASAMRISTSVSKVQPQPKSFVSLLPVYALESVRRQANEEVATIADATAISSSLLVETLSQRLSALMTRCLTDLRMLLLFTPTSTNIVSNVEQSNVRTVAFELVNIFHEAMRAALRPFTSTKESFCNLGSEAKKAELLKFVVSKNRDFDERVTLCLQILDLQRDDRKVLMLCSQRECQDLLEWFSISVAAEASTCLSKALALARSDNFEHWDTMTVENVIASAIPEQLLSFLQQQLLSLCITSIDPEAVSRYAIVPTPSPQSWSANADAGMNGGYSTPSTRAPAAVATALRDGADSMKHSSNYEQRATRARALLAGGSSTRALAVADNVVVSTLPTASAVGANDRVSMGARLAMIERDCEFLGLNERVVTAACKAYLRLGDEYCRVLQSKHWEQVAFIFLQLGVHCFDECFRFSRVTRERAKC
jgi:hypothetical protein